MTAYFTRLSPDLAVRLDESHCITLVTPERVITVTNVDAFKSALDECRTFQRMAGEECERQRRESRRQAHKRDVP